MSCFALVAAHFAGVGMTQTKPYYERIAAALDGLGPAVTDFQIEQGNESRDDYEWTEMTFLYKRRVVLLDHPTYDHEKLDVVVAALLYPAVATVKSVRERRGWFDYDEPDCYHNPFAHGPVHLRQLAAWLDEKMTQDD